MKKYYLSIIIPTFNLENSIKNAFYSIRFQTIGFENIEVIFVDDNSTDNTFQIISDYSRRFNNVKAIKINENSGFAGKPRNIGLKNSTAEYVLFLDGDDELYPGSCEVLLKNITLTDADIIIGGYINQYKDEEKADFPLPIGETEVFKTEYDMFLLNTTPAVSAKLFKKEFLINNNINFREGIPGQDLVFLMECLLKSNKINILNHLIYNRNVNENSVSLNPNEKYLYGLIKSYNLVCDLFKSNQVPIKIQEAIFKKHLGFFTTQVLRTYYSNDSNQSILHEIMNSDIFNKLENNVSFKNSDLYREYFRFMKTGHYNDAKKLINSMNFDFELIDNYYNSKEGVNT